MKRAILATMAAVALALSSGCVLVGDDWWDEDDFAGASHAPSSQHGR